MAKRFASKRLKPTAFDPKDHWMVGTVWPVQGSRGTEYGVELHHDGFECECTGFQFHGRCKHTKQILAQVEGAMG